MGIRTTSRIVNFSSPFAIKPVDGLLAAGDYEVETDEEVVETLSRTVYVRVATLLTVSRAGTKRTYRIDRDDLDAALVTDGQQALPR